MKVIGISGFAGSGKSLVASYLSSRYGFDRKHIGRPLKDMLRVLMLHAGIEKEKIERYIDGDLKESVVPEFGKTSRDLQITLGTEWGRERVSEDIWANLWKVGVTSGQKVMNDSVRFPNEEQAVGQLGGVTILIERPGTGPVAFKWGRIGKLLYRWSGKMWGVHDSERTDRLMPSFRVVNDGTIDELFEKIDTVMRRSAFAL